MWWRPFGSLPCKSTSYAAAPTPTMKFRLVGATQLDDLAAGALDADAGNDIALALQGHFGRRAIVRRGRGRGRGGRGNLSVGPGDGLDGSEGPGLQGQGRETLVRGGEDGR